MKVTDTHVYFVTGHLSNWYPCKIKFALTAISSELEFNCSEQIYMAYKALMTNDWWILEKILKSDNPKEQKELGRQVRNFNPIKWTEVSYDIMRSACMAKYQQNEKCRRRLLETGDRIIVEAAWYDKIWGVGLRETDPLILDEKNWQGSNWLGKVLMEVRAAVR